MASQDVDELDDSSAPLIEHLKELRSRLIWSALAFVVASPEHVRYSGELKQYSLDVLVAAFLALSAIFLPASFLFRGVLLALVVVGRFADKRGAAAFACQCISAGW